MKPLQQNESVDLVFEDATDCPPLFTDEAKVALILRNLISNALKFTERGEVRVAAAFDSETRQCRLRFWTPESASRPKTRSWCFRSSLRSQICCNTVPRVCDSWPAAVAAAGGELLGGTLTLRSTPGTGSTFTLCIPMSLGHVSTIAPAVVSQPRTVARRFNYR